jgi:hypothetical protein
MGDPYRGDKVTVFYSLEVCPELMRRLNLGAGKIADELGIECLELMRSLRPSLDHYYDYIQFTPAGARVVAETIAQTVLRRRGNATP